MDVLTVKSMDFTPISAKGRTHAKKFDLEFILIASEQDFFLMKQKT